MEKKKKIDNRKIAIYSRKSKFTGKGESIGNQIEICRRYIERFYTGIVEDDILIFEDEGFSGKNTNRPHYKDMIDKVKSKEIKAVVCYRLDRVSRSVGDFDNMFKFLTEMDVDFLSATENYDTTNPMGRAMLNMCTVFAQLERETIAERIRDNLHELAKSGRWLGGNTPTGYKSVEIVGSRTADGRERKAFKLEIVPSEVETVKMIYAKFLETNSLTATENYLLQTHIQSKNKKPFTRFAIKAILKNPVYMIADNAAWSFFADKNMEIYAEQADFDGKHGLMAYNKTNQTTGRTNEIRDMGDWIIAVGRHKGIITGTDWVKVQSFLGQNSSKAYRKPRSHAALLSGLLFCSCDDFMRPKLSQRKNKDGEIIYDYLCQTREKSKDFCKNKRLNGNELDKAICEKIKSLSEDDDNFFKQLQDGQKKIQTNTFAYDKELESQRKELLKNEKDIEKLISSLAEDDLSARDYIKKQINERYEQIERIKQRIKDLEILTRDNSLTDEEFEVLREMLSSFAKSYETMTVEQKRTAIRTFIKKIIWDGRQIHVYFFGEEGELDEFPEDDGGYNDGGPIGDLPESEQNSPTFSLSDEKEASTIELQMKS